MSSRRLRVRVSIGTLIVVLVVAITALDSRSSAIRVGPLLAAALGVAALVEYTRIAGIRAAAAGRAALGCGALVLFWHPVAAMAGFRDVPAGLFCAFFGLACAAPLVAAVASRRSSPVVSEDARALGAAVLGLFLVVLPVLALVEIGYFTPSGAFPPRSCPFFSSASAPITERNVGPWLLLVTILVSKLNDIGGYLVGSLVGRTPLAPGVSPKKSVEGAVAGLVLGMLGSLAAFAWFCPTAGLLGVGKSAAFGLAVSCATQVGDLSESLIKRACGVKDSAVLIPAFGGILDLLDSFILAAPAGYTLLWLWLS